MLEDLARGLQRFRRTPERIHAAYLEPMWEGLLALANAKREAEEAAEKPEHYRHSTSNSAQRPYFLEDLLGSASVYTANLKRWSDEFRGAHMLSAMDSETALQLQQQDATLLLHLYKLPQCEYIRQAYPKLALRVEEDASAIAAAVQDAEIRRILPFLLFLTQCNLRSLERLPIRTIAPYGMSLYAIAPDRLDALLTKFVGEEAGEKYSTTTATTADAAVKPYLSAIDIASLSIKHKAIRPDKTFLISSQGVPQGFLTVFNEGESHSPLSVYAHLKGNQAAAIKVAERLAAHLGYSAVKLGMSLDKDARQAAAEAGLYLLETEGLTVDTFAGVFVDMLNSDEAQRMAYGAFTKAKLEFELARLLERSMTESTESATWQNLSADEFFQAANSRHRLPDEKIRSLVLEASGKGEKVNYIFNFDGTFLHQLIYVLKGNQNGASSSLEETVNAAANGAARFFNGSVKQIGPDEMYAEEMPREKPGGVGIFYCAHTGHLPNSAVRVDANFPVSKVLSFARALAQTAGYEQARVDVCYGNLSPEELATATSILPLDKMHAVKVGTFNNLKPEDLQNEAHPHYVDKVVIQTLSFSNHVPFAVPFLVDYDSNEGLPRVTITPAAPPSQIDRNIVEEALSTLALMLWEHCETSGLTSGRLPLISLDADNSSALIRLAFLPGPSMLKQTFDELYSNSYFVKQLRYRTSVKGEDLVKP